MTACTATRHGDATAYRGGRCRCPSARADHSRSQETWRLRRLRSGGQPLIVDATGTCRRLRALARIGWTFTEIACRAGLRRQVLTLIADRRDRVKASTAEVIADLYDELSTEDGPSGRARRRAERDGWLGPECWTDATIDDPAAGPSTSAQLRSAPDEQAIVRACAGEHLPLNLAERNEAIRRLNGVGLNDQQIAERIGMSGRRVLSRRRELGLPAVTGMRKEPEAGGLAEAS